MSQRGIVAGFDGSGEARRAVRWAMGEALSRDCPLLIGQAIEPLVSAVGPMWREAQPFTEDRVRRYVDEGLSALADECRRDAPALTVDVVSRDGHPATVLIDLLEETGADQLVLGSSGHGAVPRMLLGSTAAELVRTVRRPVVVVRGERPAEPSPTAPVVVGADGSGTSDRAIGVAFDFAARRGCELHAVHAWSDRPVELLVSLGLWKPEPDHDVTEEIARTFVGAWADRYPGVDVRMAAVEDRPAHALLERSEEASLLVVGSRGRGAIRRTLLGSVSHAALYHASCPVAVVPAAEDESTPTTSLA